MVSTTELYLDRSLHTEANGSFETVNRLAAEVVSGYRFDVLPLYVDLLEQLAPDIPIHEVYDHWQPEALADLRRWGGSDCFGLAAQLNQRLRENGVASGLVPFGAEGLLAEEDVVGAVGLGSIGVTVSYPNGDLGLIEPGFSMPQQLYLTQDSSESIVGYDGRTFAASVDFETNTGQLRVNSNYHPQKNISFSLSTLDFEQIPEFQKRYLKVRTTIHCDRFDANGTRIAGLKVNLLKEKIVININGATQEIPLGDWENYDNSVLAAKLGLPAEQLKAQVAMVIRRAPQIRALWSPGLRQEYAKLHPSMPFETRQRTWEEARAEGFTGGGVVVLLTNGNQVLLYEVPESRAKPRIGRFGGQLNFLVETAEGDEEPLENFQRGLQEELGVVDPNLVNIRAYREIAYGKPFPDGSRILARVFVVDWRGETGHKFHFKDEAEGRGWRWISAAHIEGHELEPNARPIIEQLLAEELL